MHPNVSKTRLLARLVGLGLCLGAVVVSCGGKTTGPQGGSDGVSHWLTDCRLDSDCDGLDCLCGVCTRQCTDHGSCSDLHAAAICASAQGPTCALDGPENVCALAAFADAGLPVAPDSGSSSGEGGTPARAPDAGSSTGTPADSSPPDVSGRSDGGACTPFDARSSGDDCLSIDGYTFTGEACEPIVCGCDGTHCDRLYGTAGECRRAHAECLRASGDRCAPMNWSIDEVRLVVCLGAVRFAWNGSSCEPVAACACEGPDCARMFETLGACEQEHLECVLPFGARSCETHGDCELDTAQCCLCGEAGHGDVIALHPFDRELRLELACGLPPGRGCTTEECDRSISPTLYSACNDSTCEVLDVTDYAACTTDEDCSVQFKDCCACGADGSPDGVVAVSDVDGYRRTVCGLERLGCPECEGPPTPQDVNARCDGNRCVLDRAL